MPYLYETANTANVKGIPVMRAMVLEFQNDPACTYLDKQYMLGDSILVAPIFNEDGEANYYLPEGKWTDFITGKQYDGGKWINEKHDYLSIPMMVKENSLIALGYENNVPDYDYRKEVTILAYELKENVKATAKVLDMDRKESLKIEVLKTEKAINIEAKGTDKGWSIVLKNVVNVTEVCGAEYKIEGNDTRIIVKSGNSNIVCKLEG
jgi:alpha-D-xyloside xylohydrolase